MKTLKRLFSIVMVICILGGLPASVQADEPQLPVETMTYGQTLGNIQLLEATVSGVPGQWSWTDPSIRPEAGTAVYEATFTPVDSNNYNTVTAEIPVTTLQAAPVVEAAPTAATIIYGAALSDSAIEGGIVKGVDNAPLAGSWSWEDGSQRPAAGTLAFTAIFTPTDTRNYTTAKTSISVTIDQSTIDPSQITLPAASDITYGQTLADSILTGGSVEGIDGTWGWADPGIMPPAGTQAYDVTFTPVDTANYLPFTVSVTVIVNKYIIDPDGTDPVTLPAAGEVTYGQALAESALTGGSVAGIDGAWAWADPETLPEAGSRSYAVVFTPADGNIEPWTGEVTLIIHKATPVLTEADIPKASDIVYGQSIGDSILSFE